MPKKKKPPEAFAKYVIFIGPSLRGECGPVEVYVDYEVREMLERLNPPAWKALLSYVEDELAAAE